MNFSSPMEAQKQTSPCLLSEPSLTPGPSILRFHPQSQQYQHSLHAYHSCESSTQESSTSANLYALLFLATNAMNWTGGRLQRHSTITNSATTRQKQHFARVAQNLRSRSKYKSPVKWSIFNRIVEDRERSQRRSSPARTPAAPSREQSRSLAHHLSHDNARVASPHGISESTRPVGGRVNQKVAKYHHNIESTRISDDDLYNATPPPQKNKRQREESVALSDVESFVDNQEQETVLEKRRRILQRGDWVGVSIQKPLQVAFASPRDEENIGRRRKIPHGGPRARYEKRQAHITSPFLPRARCPDNVAPSIWAREQRQIQAAKSDVRISISGKVVPPGLSSSSVALTFPRQRSQDTQSDVMLLDNDNTSYIEQPILHRSPMLAYGPSSYNHSRHQQKASRLSQVYVQQEVRIDRTQTGEHLEEVESWAGTFYDSYNQLSCVERNTLGNAHHEQFDGGDTLQSTTAIPVPDLGTDSPLQVVFSSSSASIHHPKPQSSRISVLIRSDAPEGTQSTVAQVGKRQPAVPSSQAEENKVWESWIAPLYQEPLSQDTGLGNIDYRAAVNISPGISMAPNREPFETYASGRFEDSSGWGHSEHGGILKELSSEELEPQPSPEASEVCECSQQNAITADETGSQAAHSPESKGPGLVERPCAVLESKEEDPDDVWRKFIFGSSSEASAEQRETTLMPTTYGWEGHLTDIESSILAQPSTYSDQADHTFASNGESYHTRQKASHTTSRSTDGRSQYFPPIDNSSGPDSRRLSASVAVHASSSSGYTSSSENKIDNRRSRK